MYRERSALNKMRKRINTAKRFYQGKGWNWDENPSSFVRKKSKKGSPLSGRYRNRDSEPKKSGVRGFERNAGNDVWE